MTTKDGNWWRAGADRRGPIFDRPCACTPTVRNNVRGGIDGGEVDFGRLERTRQGDGVALVGGMDLCRDDGPGVEIDRVLGLVGQPGAAILQLGDLGLWVRRREPVCVGQPLALALAIQPDQVVGRRGLDAAFLGQTLQHLPVAFAAVAPDDRAQCRVGRHGRGIDADAITLDQAVLGQALRRPQ